MQVAHVINRYGMTGGAENQLYLNLRYFSDSRLSHRVIALFRSVSDEVDANLDVTYLYDEGSHPGPLAVYRSLSRELRARRPSLIHCSLADAALASRIAGPRLGIPVLESLVNLSHEPIRATDNPNVAGWKLAIHRLIDAWTMRRVDHFHALTPAVAQSWGATVGLDLARVTVVPRGVELHPLNPSKRVQARTDLGKELGLSPSAPLMVHVARQEPQKGHRYLLESLPTVVEAFPDCVLLLVGRSGNSSRVISQTIHQLSLGNNVLQLGVRSDIRRILLASDVFVFPSLFEGLGVSLLEAMATGCACVVSDLPAFQGIAIPNKSAVVVPPGDPSSLAAALIRTLENPSLRDQLGQSGRTIVEEGFDVRDTSARIEELYLKLVDQCA